MEDGLKIIKFWFSIDLNEQRKRFEERVTEPLKRWKLSTIDAQAQSKCHAFTEYKNTMFAATGTLQCPWVVVQGNDRDRGIMEAMRYVLSQMEYDKKEGTGERLVSIIAALQGNGGLAIGNPVALILQILRWSAA